MSDLIGNRICIIGLSSSGKSTLADVLSKKKNLEILHLDQIGHIPNTNWQPAPFEDWSVKHDEFIKNDKWVIDGCYHKAMSQRFEAADTVIFIRMNRFGCAYRFIKRGLQKSKKRYGDLEGASSYFSIKVLKYILMEAPKKFTKYEKIIKDNPHLRVIYLYSFLDINKLIETLD